MSAILEKPEEHSDSSRIRMDPSAEEIPEDDTEGPEEVTSTKTYDASSTDESVENEITDRPEPASEAEWLSQSVRLNFQQNTGAANHTNVQRLDKELLEWKTASEEELLEAMKLKGIVRKLESQGTFQIKLGDGQILRHVATGNMQIVRRFVPIAEWQELPEGAEVDRIAIPEGFTLETTPALVGTAKNRVRIIPKTGTKPSGAMKKETDEKELTDHFSKLMSEQPISDFPSRAQAKRENEDCALEEEFLQAREAAAIVRASERARDRFAKLQAEIALASEQAEGTNCVLIRILSN